MKKEYGTVERTNRTKGSLLYFPLFGPLFRLSASVMFAVLFWTLAQAQSGQAPAGSGAIAGQIVCEDQPLEGVTVVLQPLPAAAGETVSAARTVTDQEGGFRFARLAAGRYLVKPLAPEMVFEQDDEAKLGGRIVTLAAGETLEGVDFSLLLGGVISGQVTDGDRNPAVGAPVTATRLNEDGLPLSPSPDNARESQTDEDGHYRISGLPAGRYILSVGEADGSSVIQVGSSRGRYKRAFHPSAVEQAKAKIIEARGGSETSEIDVTLRRDAQGYQAGGLILDEFGQPVPRAVVICGEFRPDGSGLSSIKSQVFADERGEFRFAQLEPGFYEVLALAAGVDGLYGEPLPFEVGDSDLGGLEVHLRRGARIEGVVVIEGSDDPDALAQRGRLPLRLVTRTREGEEPIRTTIKVEADGGFKITGVRPGTSAITLAPLGAPKGVSLLRVELDGAPQSDEWEITAGTVVIGVRVVIGHSPSGR